MGILGEKINYESLKDKQQEIYNFQKVSSVFAEYGYSVTPLRDDVEFADFVAVPFNKNEKKEPLWVQLKSGCFIVSEKYYGKNLHICFFDQKTGKWYLYPHDKIYKEFEKNFQKAKTWDKKHEYKSFGKKAILSFLKDALDIYKID